MKISVYNHGGPGMAGREMHKSAKYFTDLKDLIHYSFEDFYEYVRNIPYRNDPSILYNSEIIARPKYLFTAGKLDCKKKAVLIAAHCNGQKPAIPYKFGAISERPDKILHHVLPIVKINNGWVVADATYRKYYMGEGKTNLTKFRII
jgi:hypothetical protein